MLIYSVQVQYLPNAFSRHFTEQQATSAQPRQGTRPRCIWLQQRSQYLLAASSLVMLATGGSTIRTVPAGMNLTDISFQYNEPSCVIFPYHLTNQTTLNITLTIFKMAKKSIVTLFSVATDIYALFKKSIQKNFALQCSKRRGGSSVV